MQPGAGSFMPVLRLFYGFEKQLLSSKIVAPPLTVLGCASEQEKESPMHASSKKIVPNVSIHCSRTEEQTRYPFMLML